MNKPPVHILADRRFWPFFITQFLGAFNDNVYKNALVILITYKVVSLGPFSTEQMVSLCGGIFILPFFLFSAIAGQVADAFSKSKLIFWIKIWEVAVMIFGAAGFLLENISLLMITLFVMGLQSTFFGPVKYSILPEMVNQDELTTATAWVETGTFVSILLGTIIGGVLIALPISNHWPVSFAVIFFAMLGVFSSAKMLPMTSNDQNLKISFNPVMPTLRILKLCTQVKSLFLSILGISWFWAVGAVFLSIIPVYTKSVLHGSEHVATFFLGLFSVGVGIGSTLCEKLSFRKLELGLVPIGSFGISLFLIDLYFVGTPIVHQNSMGISELLQTFYGKRITIDFLMFSVFSGLFIVPLYTLIQERAFPKERSRIVAANNILNALFMVVGSVGLTVLYGQGFSNAQIFLVIGLLNLVVSLYIYTVLPEFFYRFVCWVTAHLLYHLKIEGAKNIPDQGPAVIVCNHVSFVDWMIIASATQRPIRFVMHYSFSNMPIARKIFKDVRVIPIAGFKEDKQILEQAFVAIAKELKQNELVCIFPEGELSRDGEIAPFRPGIEKILKDGPVPVIPMHLAGMWGSIFSRKHKGKALSRVPRRLFFPVKLTVAKALNAQEVTAGKLEQIIKQLRGQHENS